MAILTLLDGMFGKLDEWYFRHHCRVNRASPPMFYRGWGSDAALDAVQRQWSAPDLPRAIEIDWEEDWTHADNGLQTRRGSFPTPCHAAHLPPESARARVHFVRPASAPLGPVVVIPPTSREAGVAGRWPIARTLAKQGISSVLLESPFMGRRKPAAQHGVTLQYFSDFLVLAAAAIEETRAVLHWLHLQGLDTPCVAGISKGGYLAAVAGLRSPATPRVVALLPPHSGVPVLIDGLLGRLCDWDLLQRTSPSARPVRQLVTEVFAQTSLERLPPPAASQSVTLIAARRDRYVPREAYARLARHWHGRAQVRWLAGGHVSSIAERSHFLNAITDALRPR